MSREPKQTMIERMITTHSLKRPVYIGDTEGDQRAAEEAGISFIYAAYGFREVETERSVSSFAEIVEMFVPKNAKNEN